MLWGVLLFLNLVLSGVCGYLNIGSMISEIRSDNKAKSAYEPPGRSLISGFCSVKQLRVFLLACSYCLSLGCRPVLDSPVPITTHIGEEGYCCNVVALYSNKRV